MTFSTWAIAFSVPASEGYAAHVHARLTEEVPRIEDRARLSEPVSSPVRFDLLVLAKQAIERGHHPPDRPAPTTRVLRRIHQNEAVMCCSALIGRVCQRHEVGNVLGDDRTLLLLRDSE